MEIDIGGEFMIVKDYKIRIGNSRISLNSILNGMVNGKHANRYLSYSLNNLNDKKLVLVGCEELNRVARSK